MRAVRILVFTVLLTTVSPVHAQTVVASDVSEDATDANSQRKIVFTSRGVAYLTFAKLVGDLRQVFVASSTDLRRWEMQQISRGAFPARYSALAVGPDDMVHLAWTQYDQGVGRVYYAQTVGRGWSSPVKVSPGDAYAGVPALAVDRRGTVHMVWYGIRLEAPAVRTRHGSVYEILYAALKGGQWVSPILISPGIPDSINPSVEIDDLGRIHSAWYQYDLRTYQARHTMNTGTWTPPQTVSTGRDDAFAVSLATAAKGTAYLAWERRESGGSRITFAQFQQQWSPQQQISPPDQNAFHPVVAADSDGRLYAAWSTDGQIFFRERERSWGEIKQVYAEGKNTQPALGASRGTVLLAWTQTLAGASRIQVTALRGDRAGAEPSRPGVPWTWIAVLAALLGIAWLWTQRGRLRTE